MALKAIMYHYVRPDPAGFPRFKHLHVDDFRQQLDFFEREHGFVGLRDLQAVAAGEQCPDGVLLAFDDGLMDHHQWVLPELAERGIQGFFFIPTGPLAGGGMLPVHRVHLLLGRFAADEVARHLRSLVDDSMIEQNRQEEFRQATYRHQDNPQEAVYVKRMLNYFLAYEHRGPVLDALMAHFFGDEEAELAANFYMGPEELKALRQAGMVVGSHSVSHPVMSRLSVEEQEREISESFAWLESILGPLQPKTFCYPYGGGSTFTEETERLLSRHDVAFSFAVEPRDITPEDLRQRPQALPRYDCNMFPHGQCRA